MNSSQILDTVPPKGTGIRTIQVYITLLCLALAGFAIMGKGFAYLGIPPLYIGELFLFLGLFVLVINRKAFYGALHPNKLHLILFILMMWGAFRTFPYISSYGMNAFRDAVIWAYGIFGLLIFGFIYAKPKILTELLDKYRVFVLLFPLIALALQVLLYRGISFPNLPNTDIPIINPKTGDIGVHLAGVTLFSILGLRKRDNGIITLVWALSVLGAFVMIASSNRGGALAFLIPVIVVLVLLNRIPKRVWALIGVFICLAIAGFIYNPSIHDGQGREISIQQVAINYISVFSNQDLGGNLVYTKNWRMDWWSKIVDYTVFGQYFWGGKGFGINLADDDGFQVMADHSLRSPHNSHLTMLARAGVPGFILWLILIGSWFYFTGKAAVRAKHKHERAWYHLFLFLIGYWLAFLVNASFDVFLEGPMGGIWFWVVYGVGLASVLVYHKQSQNVFIDPDSPRG